MAEEKKSKRTAGTTFPIEVDLKVYSLSAVKRACYRLAAVCATNIELPSENKALISCTPLDGTADPAALEADFLREINDGALREIVARETEGVRNLILAHALSRVALVDADLEDADYRDSDVINGQAPG